MKISIGKRPIKNGRTSLFLSFMEGGVRKRKTLGIVLDKPDTPDTRSCNRIKMEQAKRIRAKFELEFVSTVYDVPHLSLDSPSLQTAFSTYLEGYTSRDLAVVKAVGHYLYSFSEAKDLFVSHIDAAFCRNFRDYLGFHLHGSTPANYFKKFKQFVRYCHESGFLRDDPAAGCKVVVDESVDKAVLTFDELERLAATPCSNVNVKKAFLFACNTGLRWCDVVQLRAGDVDAERRELVFVQQKVERTSRHAKLKLNLNENAYSIIVEALKAPADEPLFCLPSYNYVLRVLAAWVKSAGVRKHITFHCARHTFITNLIVQGTHLSIAASLAGHSSTRHTEKYVHIADAQRREAVNRLPRLTFSNEEKAHRKRHS